MHDTGHRGSRAMLHTNTCAHTNNCIRIKLRSTACQNLQQSIWSIGRELLCLSRPSTAAKKVKHSMYKMSCRACMQPSHGANPARIVVHLKYSQCHRCSSNATFMLVGSIVISQQQLLSTYSRKMQLSEGIIKSAAPHICMWL